MGPLIAQYIAQAQTFRWVGWWGAIICGATLIVIIFGCEETVFDRQLYTKVLESENVTKIPDPSEEKKQDNPLTNNTIPHEKKIQWNKNYLMNISLQTIMNMTLFQLILKL